MTEKINYTKQLDALNKPWVESPFFNKLIEELECSELDIRKLKR